MNVRQALRLAPAEADSQWLLLHVLGLTETSWLFAHPEYELTPAQQKNFAALVNARATGQPLAYILGQWEFYGRPFFITPDVLVPRPATEELINKALPGIDAWYKKLHRPLVVADIGTGSGCIAITLALELSPPYEGGVARRDGVVILATDISASALAIAQKNAARHGVVHNIKFLQGNMLEPLGGKKVDLLIANPPYIPTHHISEDLKFEPRQALDGGPNGQTYINQIKASGIPAIVEVTGGHIATFNLN